MLAEAIKGCDRIVKKIMQMVSPVSHFDHRQYAVHVLPLPAIPFEPAVWSVAKALPSQEMLRTGWTPVALLAFQNAANIANRRSYYALTKARTSCTERGMKGSCFSSFLQELSGMFCSAFPLWLVHIIHQV